MGFDTIRPSRPLVVRTRPEQTKTEPVLITTYHNQIVEKNRPKRRTYIGIPLVALFFIIGSVFLVKEDIVKIYAMDSATNSKYIAFTPKVAEKEPLKQSFQPRIQPKNIEKEKVLDLEESVIARIGSKISMRGCYASVYAQAEKKYRVPRQILAAVHMAETGQSGDTTRTSYAGAIGPMQFKPDTFRAYAQDGDGDGIKSIYDVHDAIFSAANMLAANGASRGNLVNALYRYNHSYSYVNQVLSLAKSYGYI